MRLLIVEDEPKTAALLGTALRQEGFEVAWAEDGIRGLEEAIQGGFDLLLVDIMLPKLDGLSLVKQLRAKGDITPVIMLSAKDTTQDRVQGLDAGADDYMVKPFELDELNARVRALLRRTQSDRIPVLTFADLSLDTSTRLKTKKNRTISLTAKEYDLLELFLRHPRQVLTREMIFDRVWGYDFGGESNVLDVYIRYLRQKLEIEGETRLIHTVRGVGYVLRENP